MLAGMNSVGKKEYYWQRLVVIAGLVLLAEFAKMSRLGRVKISR